MKRKIAITLIVLFSITSIYMFSNKKFYTVQVSDSIDAPIEKVWHVLAEEYDNIHKYSEFVTDVEILGDKPVGLGCVRRCTLDDGGFMQEEIQTWEENKKLEIVIQDSSMPMVPGTSVSFQLDERNGKVQITAIGKYRLKYLGPLSPIVAKSKYTDLITYLVDIVKNNV